MYKIKDDVDLKSLQKYGFKIGREYPDNERCICNDFERDDYWLIPMDPDEPESPWYADSDFDQTIWSIHVQSHRRMWIECVPSCTYHISNMDMEPMFYALKLMIEDGIIEDDYNPEEDA
jgi:hypothetical protein